MIHRIQRFGRACDDVSGIVHDLTLPEFRIEIEPKMDEFFDSEIITLESGWYWIHLYVGPLRSWKYRIITNNLSDVEFLKLRF